jgi:hypothetical protein
MRQIFLLEFLNMTEGPLGGNDLLFLEMFKNSRLMTICIKVYIRK